MLLFGSTRLLGLRELDGLLPAFASDRKLVCVRQPSLWGSGHEASSSLTVSRADFGYSCGTRQYCGRALLSPSARRGLPCIALPLSLARHTLVLTLWSFPLLWRKQPDPGRGAFTPSQILVKPLPR